MNRSVLVGVIIGAVVATAGAAIGGYKLMSESKAPAYADGLSAEDTKDPEAISTPKPKPQPHKHSAPTYAEVLDVSAINEQRQTPREVCEDVAVTHQAPVKDEHQILGTVAGAVLGGVLGKQIGGGSGNKVATVAGAAGGGYAGNKIQESMQARNTYTTMEKRCRTEMDTHNEVVGYNVSYRLGGREGQVRMNHDPGNRIPVKNGQLVLSRQ